MSPRRPHVLPVVAVAATKEKSEPAIETPPPRPTGPVPNEDVDGDRWAAVGADWLGSERGRRGGSLRFARCCGIRL
jgi:hypothetical protein